MDILVLGESVEGRLASDVALLAEWRNPRLGSILLSDRDADAAEEVFDLIPSLQAVLARGTGPRTLARVAMATARSQDGIVVLQADDWRSGDSGSPLVQEDQQPRAEAETPAHQSPVPELVFSPVEEVPGPVWAMPAIDEEAPEPLQALSAATDEPREPLWVTTASVDEPAWAPSEPVEEAAGPAWLLSAPMEEARAPVAPQPAPLQEALGPLRERLVQAQERLAALEMSAPVQELPARRPEEDAPSLVFALPSFLRDDGDLSDDLDTPHPAMLPLQAAAPRRRLHLA